MITEQEAFSLARDALKEWGLGSADVELSGRRLDHGWRFEVVGSSGGVVGRSHPGVTATGLVVRIPDGIPDEVADEILSAGSV
jgi:hypothetical protein